MINVQLPINDFHNNLSKWYEICERVGFNYMKGKAKSVCNDTLIPHIWNRGGVYFIFGNEDDLLYVGRSVRVRDRLVTHLTYQDVCTKLFIGEATRVCGFYDDDIANQEIYESYAIKIMQPKHNKAKTSKIRGSKTAV